MREIPQLRVRTEFHFRHAYGKLERVAHVLRELGTPYAAIVDFDTWGHVRWANALKDGPCKPLFGTEVAVPLTDGRKPVAWALASECAGFYAFSSASRNPEANIPELFANARGVVRFAGAALDDPQCFDYVDINPASPMQQRRALALAARTGKPLVVTCDNYYPRPEDFDAFMAVVDRERATAQHILSRNELRAALTCLDDSQFDAACARTFEVAERCITKLERAPIVRVPGDLRSMIHAGIAYRLRERHIAEWTAEYESRMEREFALITAKEFDSYFIVVADLIQWAKQRMLVGPGRGSSAGSLVCYLLRITEIDPLPHNLLFERFIDVTRNDFPDIDIDFNDVKRDAIFGYLEERYGKECVARIGNVSTLKPRSLLARVGDKMGVPEHARHRLLDVIPPELPGSSIFGKTISHALATTDVGRRFAETYPAACVAAEAENHADHSSVHAAGVAVSTVPITHFCTVGHDGIAHLDKVDAEELNLLKIDALGLTTLSILEDAGLRDELYGLKPDDPEVFALFQQQRYTGIFQFDGPTMQKVASSLHITEFRHLDHITALSRPGPRDAGATDLYIKRARGEPVEYDHPSLEPILSHTNGIILYQEQVMRICREVAGFDWPDVIDVRKAIGKKKGNEYLDKRREQFVQGCEKTHGIAGTVADHLWDQILTFGTYGFNQSHSVAYGTVSYWCAWAKRYRPLSFYAACLRRADDAQISQILREAHEGDGVDFIAFDVDRSDMTWTVHRGELVGGWTNLFGIGPAKATKWIEKRRAGLITQADREKLDAMPLRFGELYPLRRKYRSWFEDPEGHDCENGTVILTSNKFPEGAGSYRYWPEVVWIAQVTGKRTRDENEQRLVDRRHGEVKVGDTKFADIICQDDYRIDVTCRIKSRDFEPLGRMALDNLKTGDVVLVRGKKCPGYSILHVVRMKCLTNPAALNPAFAHAIKVEGIEILPPGEGPEAKPMELDE